MGTVAMRGSSSCCLGLLALLTGAPAGAITLGQVDTFSAGTLQGWAGGSTPQNVATGGPAGANDRYLQIRAASGNLGTENDEQWAGNYASAGVTSLRFEVENQGANPLALRITLFGLESLTAFTSVDEFVLPTQSGWVTAEFVLSDLALVRTRGTDSLAQTLAGVTRLLLRHDPDPVSAPGGHNPVTALLGIDDVTAVPEPGTGGLVVAGLAALAARGRRAATGSECDRVGARRDRAVATTRGSRPGQR
jgi:hypothetical protein